MDCNEVDYYSINTVNVVLNDCNEVDYYSINTVNEVLVDCK